MPGIASPPRRPAAAPLLALALALLAACAPATPTPTDTPAPSPPATPTVAAVGATVAAPSVAASPATPGGARPFRPNPLIGRGKPVVASAGVDDAAGAVDGRYCTRPAWRTTAYPSSLAIKVGAGPRQLLVSWSSDYTGDYESNGKVPTYGLAGDYTIATSADSTDGRDGTWRTAVAVSGNLARTRAHLVPFAGATWLRLTVTAPAAGTVDNLLAIDEIDIHDASEGTADSVFFLGDSITAAAFLRCDQVQPSYAALVNAATPARFPALINGGVGGVNSAYGVERIDAWLALNPDYQVWAIGYGTNDAWQSVPPEVFERQLQAIVDRVVAAGKRPMIARIPYAAKGPQDADVQALNAAIDRLAARNGLAPGPDLYAWFKGHPEQLGGDGVHPTAAGSVAINRLWFAALQPLVTP